jgi:type IX secretion system PorP/SprF family membrane protein
MRPAFKCIFFIMFMSESYLLSAQDQHFSQFMSSPLNLNPATTGFFYGTLRLALNGKSQWQSVTRPYQTMSFALDMSPFKRRYHRDAFGLGLLVNADVAGDSKFSTTSPALSFSYITSLSRQSNHLLSIGIQTAWIFRSINYNALYFDNQYNGSYYDPDQGNNEEFGLKNYRYFDLGAGIHYFFQMSHEKSLYAGLSVFHLGGPSLSFMGDDDIRLDKKWSIYTGGQFNVSSNIDLLPQFLFVTQGPYREVLMGCQAKYMQNRYSQWDYISMIAGIYYRNKDAMIFMAGFDYKQLIFGLSYDMNVSKLRPASYYRGGLEFSLTYSYSYGKVRNKKASSIPCPIF